MIIWLSGLLLILFVLAYQRISLALSSLTLAGYFGALLWQTQMSVIALIPVILIALLLLLLNLPALRRPVFSRPIYQVMKKALPPVSQTEREALEAGNVWWDAELFSGAPDWNVLLDLPAAKLTAEEQAFIDGPVETLCAMLDDWDITHHRQDLPEEVWDYIKQEKFCGMIIPREYGGLDFSHYAHSEIVMKIASRSTSAAVTVMVPNSLGPAKLLLAYGSEKQKQHYLPRLASGKEIPCFALTGPEAGSDAGAMPDVGIVCRGQHQGKEVLGIRLNWEKRYITLGPVATVIGLAFKLFDPDHYLSEQEAIGITVALIPRNTPGVSIGKRHFPLNSAFMNGPNWGKDVFIPLDYVIGGQQQVGNGWKMLMQSLATGRGISLPALSIAGGKFCCRNTGAYARIRRQFNLPLGEFEGIEEALARMAGETYIIDAARTITANALDQGEKPSVASAIIKYELTERMRRIINDGMDVQAGSGICLGPKNYLGRLYQVIPVSITVEGANILTRTMMIFGQGAVRCHPYIHKEMQALQHDHEKQGLAIFDEVIFNHIGFVLHNLAAGLWLGLTNSCLLKTPGNTVSQRYYRRIARLSAGFALLADFALLTLGGGLKRKERISGRFADALSNLYLCSSVLKHFQDQGEPEEDLPLLHWACQHTLYKAQQSLLAVCWKLPLRPIVFILRGLLFPFGKPYSPPDDNLIHQTAALLLSDNPARDRLTHGIYINRDKNDCTGRIEHAFQLALQAAPAEKILRDAQKQGLLPKGIIGDTCLAIALENGIIKTEHAEIIIKADEARSLAIQVDAFDASELRNVHPLSG